MRLSRQSLSSAARLTIGHTITDKFPHKLQKSHK